jgi:hypothetical protein
MTIRKRGTRYYYDFMIRRQRHRGALPEARTKTEAQQAETKIKTKIYERKYGKVSASTPFSEFVRSTYLPWSRANKRSSSDDEFHAEVFCRHFGNKSLSEIDYQMIEEFKIKRMQSITRYGRTRKPASVNRELAILSGIFRMAVVTTRYHRIRAGRCNRCRKTISEQGICPSRKNIGCSLK